MEPRVCRANGRRAADGQGQPRHDQVEEPLAGGLAERHVAEGRQQWRLTASTTTSSMASQKSGMATPRLLPPRPSGRPRSGAGAGHDPGRDADEDGQDHAPGATLTGDGQALTDAGGHTSGS